MHSNQDIAFIQTRQHLRFAEFADFCRSNRSLGVCTGKPGVGKEASAQIYAQWSILKPLIEIPRPKNSVPEQLQKCHSVYWDAEINSTVKRVRSGLRLLRNKFDSLIEESLYWHEPERFKLPPRTEFLELVFINNAHRLPYACLEEINDFRKKHQIGIILLATAGFDRKIKLYDLVGCDVALFHKYDSPRSEELKQILELRWKNDEVTVDDIAITIIEELTHSNIQKALHVQAEIERIRKIASISTISPEIVHAASASLLLNPSSRSK